MDPKITVPTKESLTSMLMMVNGNPEMGIAPNPAMLSLVKNKIEQFDLPFRLEIAPNKTVTLHDKFTQGEMYLQRFITTNSAMWSMKEKAKRMALTNYPVLITGETGTGKELIARSMIGNRTGGMMQCLNCAGLPSELVESELFGHVKGAFTGAESAKMGLMQSAENSICFLDEIGEMPMHTQSKLLRALQDMEVRPVGSNKTVKINCKFVFATNRDIKEMCKAGTFRLDLYARISTLELHLTPLSSRMDDCVAIVEKMEGGASFLRKYKEKLLKGELDLSLNVRSLEQYVIRNNVLGEI